MWLAPSPELKSAFDGPKLTKKMFVTALGLRPVRNNADDGLSEELNKNYNCLENDPGSQITCDEIINDTHDDIIVHDVKDNDSSDGNVSYKKAQSDGTEQDTDDCTDGQGGEVDNIYLSKIEESVSMKELDSDPD